MAFGQGLQGLETGGKVVDRPCTALHRGFQEDVVDCQGDKQHGDPVYKCQRRIVDTGIVSQVLTRTKVYTYAENGSSLTAL
jgi:hypothetical protein